MIVLKLFIYFIPLSSFLSPFPLAFVLPTHGFFTLSVDFLHEMSNRLNQWPQAFMIMRVSIHGRALSPRGVQRMRFLPLFMRCAIRWWRWSLIALMAVVRWYLLSVANTNTNLYMPVPSERCHSLIFSDYFPFNQILYENEVTSTCEN